MSNQGRVSVKIDHTMTEDENGARGIKLVCIRQEPGCGEGRGEPALLRRRV